MVSLNTASTTAPLPTNTAAAKVPTPEAKAAPVAPPAPPSPVAAPPKDASAVKSGTGTSKLKLEPPKKPVLDTKGDDKWQTDKRLNDLHENQKDLFGNILGQVRDSKLPDAKTYEKQIIKMQEAFNKAEEKGDYKECRHIHKEMSQLAGDLMKQIEASEA